MGRTGPLVVDAGTIDSSTTGFKMVTIVQTLAAGWYFLCCAQQGGTPPPGSFALDGTPESSAAVSPYWTTRQQCWTSTTTSRSGHVGRQGTPHLDLLTSPPATCRVSVAFGRASVLGRLSIRGAHRLLDRA